MSQLNLDTLFDSLPGFFQPVEPVHGSKRILFDLSGDSGGAWTIILKGTDCTVEKTSIENPDLTIRADSKDVFSLLTGKMNPRLAIMTGKVHLNGNMGLALDLLGLFKVDKEKLAALGLKLD